MPSLETHLSEALTPLLGDPPSGTVAVAWSGGLDSTVLLDLSHRSTRRSPVELAAIHVDHHLGPESSRRAAFCTRWAARRGIPLVIEQIAPAETGASLEAQLRMQRYAALGDAAERLEADVVLTAHQANDAVETALLRFVRGTGAAGFAGLARRRSPTAASTPGPVASWPEISLLRPLLSHSRRDLADYAERRGLDWRTDPANSSDAQTRNRLRDEVVPVLEREAGSLEPMLRTLDNVAADADALDDHLEHLLERARRRDPAADSVALDTSELARAPEAEIAAALRRVGADLPTPPRWRRDRLDEAIRHLRAVAAGEADRRTIDLGGGRLTIEPRRTILAQSRERGGRDLEDRRTVPIRLQVGTSGRASWFDHRLAWRLLEPDDPTDFPTDASTAWFDAGSLPDELVLRGPTPGETLAPFGLDGKKSIADVLREGDVPSSERWRWPCLALAGDDEPGACIWVVGLRQAKTAAVSAETSRVLEIDFQHGDGTRHGNPG